jgi:predicted AlkP superfamily phosphohydrolase/phosphomutase
LNTWLYRAGYLNFTKRRYLANMITFARKHDPFNLGKRLVGKMIKSPTALMKLSGKTTHNLINWRKTQAFSIGGLIWGNMYCSDDQLLIKIIEELESWKESPTSKKIIQRIYKKEEIFSGPLVESFPNIFLEPNQGYAFHTPLIKDMKMFHRANVHRHDRVGTHDRDGIILIKGKNVKQRRNVRASIIDLAPTILALLELPVPTYMDGRALEDFFAEGLKVNIQEMRYARRGFDHKGMDVDSQEIEKRLRDLGYL